MSQAADLEAPRTTGRVLHSPVFYDLLAWTFMRGREGAFRDRVLDLARLASGERVLDVGCGTGTLAIAATRRVGHCGTVVGIDASPSMIGRARRKAGRAHAEVEFRPAVIETLPFADNSFDVVLSTLMVHHLPRPLKEAGAREIHRVLKPGGRALVVDFGAPRRPAGILGRLHRHGRVRFDDVEALLAGGGFRPLDRGEVGFKDLEFVLVAK